MTPTLPPLFLWNSYVSWWVAKNRPKVRTDSVWSWKVDRCLAERLGDYAHKSLHLTGRAGKNFPWETWTESRPTVRDVTVCSDKTVPAASRHVFCYYFYYLFPTLNYNSLTCRFRTRTGFLNHFFKCVWKWHAKKYTLFLKIAPTVLLKKFSQHNST